MSVRANFDDTETVKRSLIDQGAVIFKVVERDEILPGLGLQPSHNQIVFYFPDDSNGTMFKLKHPHGTYAEH